MEAPSVTSKHCWLHQHQIHGRDITVAASLLTMRDALCKCWRRRAGHVWRRYIAEHECAECKSRMGQSAPHDSRWKSSRRQSCFPGNNAPSTVFTYGHRNPQGLAFNPFTNEIWEDEHGPKGGDEINIIRKGKNYGWPLVSYGVNYDGNPVSASPEKDGVENPIHTWTPSIAPCGMAFITSDKYGAWKGNVLVGSLAFTHLTRLQISSNRITKETKMLEGVGRVRNVKAGAGWIYLCECGRAGEDFEVCGAVNDSVIYCFVDSKKEKGLVKNFCLCQPAFYHLRPHVLLRG
jgi:hypothetical protein